MIEFKMGPDDRVDDLEGMARTLESSGGLGLLLMQQTAYLPLAGRGGG